MPASVYGMYASPPTRAVLIAAEAVGLPVDVKTVNLFSREHKKPEFLKINPLHTVPVLDDNGTILIESHAINPYLVSKYGQDESLYPKDLVTRAIVDHRLHFDNNTVFPRLKEAVAVILPGGTTLPEDWKQRTRQTLTYLSAVLGDNDWIAHTKNYTVADISLLCTLENIGWLAPYLLNEFPTLSKWLERGRKSITGYDAITSKGKTQFYENCSSRLKP